MSFIFAFLSPAFEKFVFARAVAAVKFLDNVLRKALTSARATIGPPIALEWVFQTADAE